MTGPFTSERCRLTPASASRWLIASRLSRAEASMAFTAEHIRMRCFNRSEEHTSELQSLMRTSYAVFCLKKKPTTRSHHQSGKPTAHGSTTPPTTAPNHEDEGTRR